MAIIDAETQRVISQLSTPALSQMEWTASRERLTLGAREFSMAAEAVANPPRPTAALRSAVRTGRKPRGGESDIIGVTAMLDRIGNLHIDA
jgi:hypothetical protein